MSYSQIDNTKNNKLIHAWIKLNNFLQNDETQEKIVG